MIKGLLASLAAIALFAGVTAANAADTLSNEEMDSVKAGAGFDNPQNTTPTSMNIGSYTLVYNGSTWTRVKN